MTSFFRYVLALLLSTTLAVPAPFFNALNWTETGAAYDSESQAYFDAIVANGGTISTGTKDSVNTFILAAKANGYWSKIKRINLFCGNQLAAALVAIRPGVGTAVDTAYNFGGGDYTLTGGLTGDGTSKYLDTGLLASAITPNSTHVAQYNKNNITTATTAIGAMSSGLERLSCHFPYSGTLYADFYRAAGSDRISCSTVGAGLHIGSRTSSTYTSIYVAGTLAQQSFDTVSGTPAGVNLSLFVFAANDNGSAAHYYSDTLLGYSFGDGLSAGDAANLSTDWAALKTALGR